MVIKDKDNECKFGMNSFCNLVKKKRFDGIAQLGNFGNGICFEMLIYFLKHFSEFSNKQASYYSSSSVLPKISNPMEYKWYNCITQPYDKSLKKDYYLPFFNALGEVHANAKKLRLETLKHFVEKIFGLSSSIVVVEEPVGDNTKDIFNVFDEETAVDNIIRMIGIDYKITRNGVESKIAHMVGLIEYEKQRYFLDPASGVYQLSNEDTGYWPTENIIAEEISKYYIDEIWKKYNVQDVVSDIETSIIRCTL